MPQIENPYNTEEQRTLNNPSPGELAIRFAALAEMVFRFFGVNLYQHEFNGLAAVIGAILRGYPRIGELWVDVKNKEGTKEGG